MYKDKGNHKSVGQQRIYLKYPHHIKYLQINPPKNGVWFYRH